MKKLSYRAFRALVITAVTLGILAVLLGGIGIYTALPIRGALSGAPYDKQSEFNPLEYPSFTVDEGASFKILQLTDIHFVMDNGIDAATERLIKSVIARADADFIALTGDICYTPFNVYAYERITRIMREAGLPWTFIFGNHDSTGPADKPKLAEIALTADNCFFMPGPSNIHGFGNQIIRLVTNAGAPFYNLYFLDSNEGRNWIAEGIIPGDLGYDYVYPDQIEWYEWAVNGAAAAAGKTVPSLLFQHIPLPEYKTASKLLDEGSTEVQLLHGRFNERVCPPPVNTGLFDKITALGSTRAVFCGHDHFNTLSVLYKNVQLVYGRNSGYGGYGITGPKGGLLITIGSDLSFSLQELIY